MITQLCTGLYADPDVAEGYVRLEREYQRRVALYCAPATATRVLRAAAVGRIKDLYGETFDVDLMIPENLLVPSLDDELADVAAALRLLEPDYLAEFCQYPPCILPTERVAAGYGLCAHHGDRLVDAAAEWAAA